MNFLFKIPVVAIDSYYYGKLVLPTLNILLYNVFSKHGPNLYGTEPFSFYLLNLFLNFNFMAIVSLASLPILVRRYFGTKLQGLMRTFSNFLVALLVSNQKSKFAGSILSDELIVLVVHNIFPTSSQGRTFPVSNLSIGITNSRPQPGQFSQAESKTQRPQAELLQKYLQIVPSNFHVAIVVKNGSSSHWLQWFDQDLPPFQ